MNVHFFGQPSAFRLRNSLPFLTVHHHRDRSFTVYFSFLSEDLILRFYEDLALRSSRDLTVRSYENQLMGRVTFAKLFVTVTVETELERIWNGHIMVTSRL